MLACSLFKVFFNRKFKSHDAWSIRSSFDREKLVFSIFLKPKNSPFRDRNLVAPPKLKLRQKRNINEFIQAFSCFFNRNRMTRIQFDVLLIVKSTFFRYFRNRKFSRFRNFGIAIWTPPDAQITSKTQHILMYAFVLLFFQCSFNEHRETLKLRFRSVAKKSKKYVFRDQTKFELNTRRAISIKRSWPCVHTIKINVCFFDIIWASGGVQIAIPFGCEKIEKKRGCFLAHFCKSFCLNLEHKWQGASGYVLLCGTFYHFFFFNG